MANIVEFEDLRCGAVEDVKPLVSVLVVTATITESRALWSAMQPLPGLNCIGKTPLGTETYYVGRLGAYGIVHCQCAGTGGTPALMATEHAIVRWGPRAVIMVGIAWGAPKAGRNICDVLLSTSVVPFGPTRVGPQVLPRSTASGAGHLLFNRFTNAHDWSFTKPDGTVPEVIRGLVLSGDELLDLAERRDELLERFKGSGDAEPVGGDMESASVAYAADDSTHEWIVVKSICDWGESKDKQWQPLAAEAAVDLTRHVLSHPDALADLGAESIESAGVALKPVPAETVRLAGAPLQIPRIGVFIGRQEEADAVITAVAPKDGPLGGVCLVHGLAGSGKTTLAAHIAERLHGQGRLRDGVIWVSLSDTDTPAARRQVLMSLGMLEDSSSLGDRELKERYDRALGGRRLLLVLDNAYSEEEILPLLPPSDSEVGVVVTSRRHLRSLHHQVSGMVQLLPMTAPESVDLLKAYSPDPRQVESEPDAAEDVAELAGRLPLGVSIAASLLKRRVTYPRIDVLRDQLVDESSRLQSKGGAGEAAGDNPVLSLAYQRLGVDEMCVLRRLPLLGRRAFGSSAAMLLLGWPKSKAVNSLDALVAASLLQRSSEDGRYVLHDVVFTFAKTKLREEESAEEQCHLTEAAAHYWAEMHRAEQLNRAATRQMRRDKCSEAIATYDEARSIYEGLHDRLGQAYSLGGMASAHQKQGQAKEALDCLEDAERINKELDFAPGLASTYGGMASAYESLGHLDDAIDYYTRAHRINDMRGDRRGMAAAYGGLATTFKSKANQETDLTQKRIHLETALYYYEQAHSLNQEVGILANNAKSLGGLAGIHCQLGDYGRAVADYERALKINQATRNQRGIAQSLAGLASVYARMQSYSFAVTCFEEARAIQKSSDMRGYARTTASLAGAEEHRGNREAAMELYGEAASVFRKVSDRTGLSRTLKALIRAADVAGREDRAEQARRELKSLEGGRGGRIGTRR